MKDITHKTNTLRTAMAEATVRVSTQDTIDAITGKTVEKGDVFEMSKTAGLFAVKKTAEMIPDCHPMPVEYTGITFEIEGLTIRVKIIVKTIYKTGVEVEAMHGASVVALTMYDMLKPIDKGIEIENIRLIKKRGGKSDFKNLLDEQLKAAVVVCSDTISAGVKEDKAGKAIIEKLEAFDILSPEYVIIPDDTDKITATVEGFCKGGMNLVIVAGGTGLSPRDNTPEALKSLIDKEVPGIMEAARAHGQDRIPYSMLSRGVAGMHKNTLILAIPGSTNGAKETMDALLPGILHIFKVQDTAFAH
ncbi:MAG TPA: bifunctional molybdenum cofactor biosynthesis protein MoaC/MoaB [Flavobacteriales bacterium]|nr:bifunctional molybdenum cofactor biosynthesis protein MoaC/MoaB [Flavobacteriales bacterium]